MTPPLTSMQGTTFMNYLANEGFSTTTNWFVQIELYGGTNSEINKVPSNETAFANRGFTFTIQFYTSAPCGLPPFPEAGYALLDGMVTSIVNSRPSGSNWVYGAYANYIDDRLIDKDWQHLYYGANYQRLQTLKKLHDPNDVFKFPLAIEEPGVVKKELNDASTYLQAPLSLV